MYKSVCIYICCLIYVSDNSAVFLNHRRHVEKQKSWGKSGSVVAIQSKFRNLCHFEGLCYLIPSLFYFNLRMPGQGWTVQNDTLM